MAGRTNHKNLLQEIAQKMGMALPSYQNVNEGFAHAPKFRSTVHVDGVAYSSSETFVRVIDAEQHVSKVAYQCVFQKIVDEAHQFILQNPVHSKSTLMEYAVQVKSEAPTYTTRELKSKIRLFSSSVVFEGETYDGPVSMSKKEAEQSAAFVVIQSILGTTSGPRLAQVIKIKSKVFGGSNNVIGRKRPCPSTEEGGEPQVGRENPVHSKSTLMEYAVQVKSEAPTYTTRELKSKIPLFSSSVVFEGETYDGPVAKSKKEAEQSAAFVVIQSILGTTSGPRLAQVINTKSKVFGGSNNVIGS